MNNRQKLMVKLKNIIGPNSSIDHIRKNSTKTLSSSKLRDLSPYLNLKLLPKQKNAYPMRKFPQAKRESLINTRIPDTSASTTKIKSPNDLSNTPNLNTPEPQSYRIKKISPNLRLYKKKTSNYKDKISEFGLDYINNRLDALEKKPKSSSIIDYLEIFEIIISKDHIFADSLKRIKNAIYSWKIFCDESHEYIHNLEMKISEKQFINQIIMNKVHDNSKIFDSSSDKSQDAEKNGDAKKPLYTIMPLDEINYLKQENSQLNTKIESMMKEMKIMAEKEQKYVGLISALRDRGYPIEGVFLKDVCWKSKGISNCSAPNSGYASYDELEKKYNGKIDKSFVDFLSSDGSINDSY
ncbi:hypothetical protein SteCoe_5758 [Stentor coeruleus]|uniref:Translin-associated factor X-interacting protein 1 N-terminal domain-containing protein n=1 Tax=Stentor coeruleus TaxID=5963 RepID=A0A1R2CRH5_9CILI|nr:hypothetical protein SteCoe_5758 [Stentor coeruleus]